MHQVDPELDGVIVHLHHFVWQLDFVNPEADPLEAELPGDVDAAKLHVHSHDLHRADAPECQILRTLKVSIVL